MKKSFFLGLTMAPFFGFIGAYILHAHNGGLMQEVPPEEPIRGGMFVVLLLGVLIVPSLNAIILSRGGKIQKYPLLAGAFLGVLIGIFVGIKASTGETLYLENSDLEGTKSPIPTPDGWGIVVFLVVWVAMCLVALLVSWRDKEQQSG